MNLKTNYVKYLYSIKVRNVSNQTVPEISIIIINQVKVIYK